MTGQGDYGEQILPPDLERLARQIAYELREQERPFWIERDIHHLDHVFIGEMRAIREQDDARRRWVDHQIDQEMDAEARAADSRQKIKTTILGGVGLAGASWILIQIGGAMQQAAKGFWQSFMGG